MVTGFHPPRSQALACAEVVRGVRVETERKFLRAGMALTSVCACFDALEHPIRDIAAFASSDGATELTETIRQNEAALRGLLANFERSRLPLEQICRDVRAMQGVAARLSGVIRTMTIVALNARVAVAQIAETTGSMAVFSRDAPELVRTATLRVAEVDEALAALSHMVASAQERSSGLGGLFAEHATTAAQDILSGIARLDTHMSALMTRGGKLGQNAQAIRDAVSKALVALQSGDAMRQGLEHVEIVFEAAEDPRVGEGLRLALADLAGEQAAAAIARHMPHLQQMERQLAAANARTQGFLHEVEDLFLPGRSGLTDLLAAYARIGTILAEGAGLQRALGEEARALSGSVDRVQDIVHEIGAIEMRINLIGINAVIACAGLGLDGLPLKVIAHQLRELVEQSSGRVRDLTANLGQIRSSSAQIADLFDRQSTDMQAIRDELETKVASGLAALRRSLAAAQTAISDNNRLLAENLTDGLRAMSDHRDEIGRMGAQLQAMAPQGPPSQPLCLSSGESALLADIRARLSIEAERTVHDAWLVRIGQQDARQTAAPPARAAGADIVLF